VNFNNFKLKKLIATCYDGSPIASTQITLFDTEPEEDKTTKVPHKIEVTELKDYNGDNSVDLRDVEWLMANTKHTLTRLKGDGDFRSAEVTALRDQADIIVTNPPFSLFREFMAWIMDAGKQFLVIGNMNAITYKEVFPLIKDNKVWLGVCSGAREYIVPGGTIQKLGNTNWFTNLDHGRRHQPLVLMTAEDNLRFSKYKDFRDKNNYDRYENYDAIDVPFTDVIPSDYDGVMGVPISFLDKYCPSQFEILGTSDNGLVSDEYKTTSGLTQTFVDDYYAAGGKGSYREGNPTAGMYVDGIATMVYKRIFIRKLSDT